MFGIRTGGLAAAIALLGTTIGAGPQAWDSPAAASTLPHIIVAPQATIPEAAIDVSPQVPVQSFTLPVSASPEIPAAPVSAAPVPAAPVAAEPVLPIVSVVSSAPLVAAPSIGPVPREHASLASMVAAHRSASVPDRERECLAGAIYFESKGEPLSGQIAVGQVIANRAKSGRFPSSWCGVVFQRSQFSFVRGHALPPIPRASADWKTAVAVAHIVANDLHDAVAPKSLFFHARYVSPGWKRMSKVATVGNHIFYR